MSNESILELHRDIMQEDNNKQMEEKEKKKPLVRKPTNAEAINKNLDDKRTENTEDTSSKANEKRVEPIEQKSTESVVELLRDARIEDDNKEKEEKEKKKPLVPDDKRKENTEASPSRANTEPVLDIGTKTYEKYLHLLRNGQKDDVNEESEEEEQEEEKKKPLVPKPSDTEAINKNTDNKRTKDTETSTSRATQPGDQQVSNVETAAEKLFKAKERSGKKEVKKKSMEQKSNERVKELIKDNMQEDDNKQIEEKEKKKPLVRKPTDAEAINKNLDDKRTENTEATSSKANVKRVEPIEQKSTESIVKLLRDARIEDVNKEKEEKKPLVPDDKRNEDTGSSPSRANTEPVLDIGTKPYEKYLYLLRNGQK